jgi:hypothetical protein
MRRVESVSCPLHSYVDRQQYGLVQIRDDVEAVQARAPSAEFAYTKRMVELLHVAQVLIIVGLEVTHTKCCSPPSAGLPV